MNHKDTSFSEKFWNFNLYLKINFFNCPHYKLIIVLDSHPGTFTGYASFQPIRMTSSHLILLYPLAGTAF